MLIDEIKRRALDAMRRKDTLEREVLRLVIAEVQTSEARQNRPLGDDETASIVRKLVKSNEETLAIATDDGQKADLNGEIRVLRSLLPKELTVDEIVTALSPVHDNLRAAANPGQATGIAMKHLKAQGHSISGATVTAAVAKVRQ